MRSSGLVLAITVAALAVLITDAVGTETFLSTKTKKKATSGGSSSRSMSTTKSPPMPSTNTQAARGSSAHRASERTHTDKKKASGSEDLKKKRIIEKILMDKNMLDNRESLAASAGGNMQTLPADGTGTGSPFPDATGGSSGGGAAAVGPAPAPGILVPPGLDTYNAAPDLPPSVPNPKGIAGWFPDRSKPVVIDNPEKYSDKTPQMSIESSTSGSSSGSETDAPLAYTLHSVMPDKSPIEQTPAAAAGSASMPYTGPYKPAAASPAPAPAPIMPQWFSDMEATQDKQGFNPDKRGANVSPDLWGGSKVYGSGS